jgi:hypothetical protein
MRYQADRDRFALLAASATDSPRLIRSISILLIIRYLSKLLVRVLIPPVGHEPTAHRSQHGSPSSCHQLHPTALMPVQHITFHSQTYRCTDYLVCLH